VAPWQPRFCCPVAAAVPAHASAILLPMHQFCMRVFSGPGEAGDTPASQTRQISHARAPQSSGRDAGGSGWVGRTVCRPRQD